MGVAQVLVGKIFVHRLQTTKSTKILPLENYPLYGIIIVHNCKFDFSSFVPYWQVTLKLDINFFEGAKFREKLAKTSRIIFHIQE